MVVGLATELVDVERLRSELETAGSPSPDSHWTEAERETCMRRSDPAPGLAARLAAKRAARTALGLPTGSCLRQIEVAARGDGRPELLLAGEARLAAERMGVRGIHLSLSHERSAALAVVLLES